MSSGIESVAINHIKPGDVVEVLLLAGKTEQLTVSQVNRANNIVTGTGIEGITVKAENGQESFCSFIKYYTYISPTALVHHLDVKLHSKSVMSVLSCKSNQCITNVSFCNS